MVDLLVTVLIKANREIYREDKGEYPELRLMTSTGLPANNEPGNEEAREPVGDEVGCSASCHDHFLTKQ